MLIFVRQGVDGNKNIPTFENFRFHTLQPRVLMQALRATRPNDPRCSEVGEQLIRTKLVQGAMGAIIEVKL